MNKRTVLLVVLLVGTILAIETAAKAPLGQNYPGSSLEVNRTGDAVQALASGHIGRFFATQPPIGPVSVVVRAPFAALAGISHDLVALDPRYGGKPPLVLPPGFAESQQRLFRFGVFPCLMALVFMAMAGAAVLQRYGRPWWTQLLVAALMLGLPLWHGGIALGHPDEFLTAGLTIGAVLAAGTGRWKLAAVLLGLGLASKQWALLALPATAFAAPRHMRVRTAVMSVGVFAACMIPMAIGNHDRFVDAMTAPSLGSQNYVDAMSIWFPLAPHHDVTIFDGVKHVTIPLRHVSDRIESALHPTMVIAAWVLSFAFALRRKDWTLGQVFQLLALIFLVRCMFQTGDKDYYHAAFIASLAMYEGLTRGLPVLTLIVTATFLPGYGTDLSSMERANALYLAWSIPMLVYLSWSVYRREPRARLAAPAKAVSSGSYSA
jgi:hypothetical protein